MKVLLSDSFTKISVTTGTIQNVSDNIIEISSDQTINNGVLLKPYDMFCFSDTTLYARCYNGGGGYIRVVSFGLGTVGSGGSSSGGADTSGDSSNYDETTDDIWDTSGDSTQTYDPDWDSELDNIFNS